VNHRILSVTPNPAIDRVIFVRNFHLGAVVRADRQTVTPCGKGVNASMVIHELGGDTVALGLTAGLTGEQHMRLLDELGVAYSFLPTEGEARMQMVLVDKAAGQQSTISTQSMRASPDDLAQLLGLVDRHAEKSWGLLCGGALPPGLPRDSYAQIIHRAREHRLLTLLDSSGDGLRFGLDGFPHILKINLDELAMLDKKAASAIQAGAQNGIRYLSHRLGDWASDALIITLGANGVLAVTPQAGYAAQALEVPPVNTAGAGDAMAGAIMLSRSRGDGWSKALALGIAAAASVVMTEGTGICHREEVERLVQQVEVHETVRIG